MGNNWKFDESIKVYGMTRSENLKAWRDERRSRAAFSLIEMIGVLSIIAILAAAAAPAFIKRIDHESKTVEQRKLRQYSETLIRAAVQDRRIRALSEWPQRIASSLDQHLSQVSTNSRRFPRVFLAHPDLSIAGAGLPYVQGASGSATLPVSARGLILSTIATALPDLSSISAADFDNIWNTPDGTMPTALSSWTGRAEDLIVERVEFSPLFHKVLLVNVDPSPYVGRYSIDIPANAWVNTLPSVNHESSFAAYFMSGTVLTFYRNNNLRDSSEILASDMSFTYKNDRWARRLGSSDDVMGNFGQLIGDFLSPPAPADPKFAATQQAVVNEMFSFLWEYAAWARGDPSTNYTYSGTNIWPAVPQFHGDTPNYPSYSRVYEAQVNLESFTDNLIH